MTSFKVTLTFDELPKLKTHKEMLKKELFDRVDSNEYFTKNISYTDKSVSFKGNKLFFKFLSDNYGQRTLPVMKRWADKNVRKSLVGRNKYYLDTYKVKKYRVTAKENKKLKKAIKEYESEWAKGGESRKLSLKKLKKTKKLYGGSRNRKYKRTRKTNK